MTLRGLLDKALQHPGRLLGLSIAIIILFIAATTATAPGGISIPALRDSIDRMLTLLLAIDSPRQVLRGHGMAMIVLGWMVCLMGWLFVPLLVGVLVDISLSRVESYVKLRLMFRELGVSANLDGETLKNFVDEMMERAAHIIAREK
jgi:hypothetical protein